MLVNLKVAIKGLRRATADSLAHLCGDMHEQLQSLFTHQISRGNLRSRGSRVLFAIRGDGSVANEDAGAVRTAPS